MNKTLNILTYGTFDSLHIGHINLLKRAAELGSVYVGVSTDEFNMIKGKKALQSYEDRKTIVESIKYVHCVFPEKDWMQKESDIQKYDIDIFVMGSDWKGKFDDLPCEVVYFERTPNIDSTRIRDEKKHCS